MSSYPYRKCKTRKRLFIPHDGALLQEGHLYPNPVPVKNIIPLNETLEIDLFKTKNIFDTLTRTHTGEKVFSIEVDEKLKIISFGNESLCVEENKNNVQNILSLPFDTVQSLLKTLTSVWKRYNPLHSEAMGSTE